MSARIPGPTIPRPKRWDSRRHVDPRLLGMQFFVCVGSWTIVVLCLSGRVSPVGFTSSVVTASVLVVASWLLTKLGWNVSGPQISSLDEQTVG